MTGFADRVAPVLDATEYPKRWRDYIGQTEAVDMMRTAAQSARIRKEPMDHTLVASRIAGLGKTALAVCAANELKRPARVISGTIGKDAARLIIGGMKDRDVLFYDEIHQAGKAGEMWMLTYMQDNAINGPLGLEEMPRVTLIGATTEGHKLSPALKRRFMLQPPMTGYSNEEGAKIVTMASASILGTEGLPRVTGKDALALSAAVGNNPGAIKRMLTVLRDLTVTRRLPMRGTGYDIRALLACQGITPDGLDRDAQLYLRVLAEEFSGTAGARPLEDRLRLTAALDEVEDSLMDRGLIAKTKGGRMLTAAGVLRYHELKEAS